MKKKRSLCISRANKYEWPVDFERHDTPSLIEVFPLRPREMDTAWILDTMFPPPSNPCILEPEVVDVNPELSRILESCLDENDELRTDLNGRSPWRTKVPTLVGSGRFMVRHVDPTIPAHATCKRFVVRLLEPFECFRLIGLLVGPIPGQTGPGFLGIGLGPLPQLGRKRLFVLSLSSVDGIDVGDLGPIPQRTATITACVSRRAAASRPGSTSIDGGSV